MTKAIIGIGNIAAEYYRTRHSTGLHFIDRLALHSKVPMKVDTQLRAVIGAAKVHGEDVVLAGCTVPMNLSGEAIERIARRYGLEASDMLIVHDELDLAAGVVRMKEGGGTGGHNGLRSIAERVGPNFARLRLGIGRPPAGSGILDYVMEAPSPTEYQLIETAMEEAADALETWVTDGPLAAMNSLHAPKAPVAPAPEDPAPLA